jgi:2-amino-4-hydroxy-6-hydroxymethyldihydropteridine diphosphokinase
MIFLGLGSNLGDKRASLDTALAMLHLRGVRVLRVSPYLETAPWGVTDQDWFVNAVAEVTFSGSPEELLAICQAVELQLGRERLLKWGPRTIDIDLIEFNGEIRVSATLTLPHPLYRERDFVMLPLRQLEPDWV